MSVDGVGHVVGGRTRQTSPKILPVEAKVAAGRMGSAASRGLERGGSAVKGRRGAGGAKIAKASPAPPAFAVPSIPYDFARARYVINRGSEPRALVGSRIAEEEGTDGSLERVLRRCLRNAARHFRELQLQP